jgi:hypothetical protein
MFTHLIKRLVPLFLVVLLLFTTIPGVASPLAQEPPDDSPGIDTTEPVAPVEPPLVNPPAEGEEEAKLVEPAAITAIPAATMNYQGVLKDADGHGVTGTYAMTFRLYDAATNGTKEWGDEVHPTVQVENGLFHVVLGAILPFDVVADFDEQLFLEVQVGAVKLPRLALRAAPYAMGLVGGATVKANTATVTAYALTIENAGGRGLYANSKDNGGYGIYNADVTYSSEGYAGPDTYLWVPAMSGRIKYADRSDAHVEAQTYGEIHVVSDIEPSSADMELPMQYERSYGRDYKVVEFTVFYKTTNANAFITQSWLVGRNFTTGANATLAHDGGTDRKSTAYASYTVTPATPVEISSSNVPTNLQLRLQYNAAGTVTIYGARLRLRSTP